MFNKIIFPSALIAITFATGKSDTFTITNSGTTFSPSTIIIAEGDTVVFSLAAIHNAVEVEQSTWNANGSTALPGGFSTGFGGGMITAIAAGTHYYVCQPHSSFGMKGAITVTPATGIRKDVVIPELIKPTVIIDDNRVIIIGLYSGFHNNPATVYDVTGREHNSITALWNNDRSSVSINVHSLAFGIYFARFSGTSGGTAVKFAIAH